MAEALIPIVVVPAIFGTLAFIVYVVVELFRSRHRVKATTELQGKLIERLTGSDIGAFLSSEHGARLMRSLGEAPARAQAHVRILRALQGGVVFLAVGISLFVYSATRSLPLEVEDGVSFIATLGTALGLGLLGAAGASYALSRRLGLLESGAAE
jgi:hypothetical protein